jgi:aminoglycoside/choline kinase family phosphotransferase
MAVHGFGRATGDQRLAALLAWVQRIGHDVSDWAVASADASFRRYFRLWLESGSVIAMDAPPEREGCEAFIRISGLLREAGVNAPRVLAADLARGYLLLDDLGDRSYLDALSGGQAAPLLRAAIDALVKWQAATRANRLPPYDEATLRRELRLFPEWYLGAHLGWSQAERETVEWQAIEDALVARALAQPRVYVHRDYMPRNLMCSEPLPGVIDFQDALYGPVTYDIVSLLRDAFVDWSPGFEAWCFEYYWQQARAAGVPVHPDYKTFRRDLDWMGVQRHLKVLGIFARLRYRDNKPHYLAEAPRFTGYLWRESADEPDLVGLRRLLEGIAGSA